VRIGELRELRVLRADLSPDVESLPDSMSQLTNLEELNLDAPGLRSLFPGMGECRELKRLLLLTHEPIRLPHSLTQLRRLSHVYITATEGIWNPPGMSAVTSLRVLELGNCYHHFMAGASDLLVPSLRRLASKPGLPYDMSSLTTLQELKLSEYFHHSLWTLRSLCILELSCMVSPAAIPSAISRLSLLEKLQIDSYDSLQSLPDSLAELPHLNQLTLSNIPNLRSLPPSIGGWPSLKALYLYHLPKLRVPRRLLSRLQRGLDLHVEDCPAILNNA